MSKCLERVNDRHFWNPGVFSYAMMRRCGPNSRLFFIVTSIVYAIHESKKNKIKQRTRGCILGPARCLLGKQEEHIDEHCMGKRVPAGSSSF
jgi:hypothetical protein